MWTNIFNFDHSWKFINIIFFTMDFGIILGFKVIDEN
jgi:hypothetical protein